MAELEVTISAPVGAACSPASQRLPLHAADDFARRIEELEDGPLRGATIDTVQVNIGLRCNMACHHCHVESSPKRTEQMDWATMELVLDAARRAQATTLDITGGAPEMHPEFRRLVVAARLQGLAVMVRTNLTILNEPSYSDLPGFFAEKRVRLVASLPCYLKENVTRQRGTRAYQGSIDALRTLNAVGYGVDPELELTLVFNPGGPSLPPEQAGLEAAYRQELHERFGIRFTRVITMTNLPIGRFLHDLRRDGHAEDYLALLRDSFNPATVAGLMCRHQLHVGHDGRIYDCDFNFAVGRGVSVDTAGHIRDFDPDGHVRRRIVTSTHCFACAAGAGSSCSGALA